MALVHLMYIKDRYSLENLLLVSQLPSILKTFRKDYKIITKGIIFTLINKLTMFQPNHQILSSIHRKTSQHDIKTSQLVWLWFELHEDKCTSLWKDIYKIPLKNPTLLKISIFNYIKMYSQKYTMFSVQTVDS